MMICPESFIAEHAGDTFDQLLMLRNELIHDIQAFEEKRLAESQWMIRPSPEVIYQMNLKYLSVLCDYIAERYNQEYVFPEEEDDL